MRALAITMVALAIGCGGDRAPELDAGDPCGGPHEGLPFAGCPCGLEGQLVCRAGCGLMCASGTWTMLCDGPCGGRDAGVFPDAGADAAAPIDAGTDAGPIADDAGTTDAGVDSGIPTSIDSGVDAGTPAEMTYCVDVFVSNTCEMSVSPTSITIPRDQTAYFCWRNTSSDYPIDVWMSYGGGYTDLAPGATWNEPVGHCLGPTAHDEYADISTACSDFRFLIHCL